MVTSTSSGQALRHDIDAHLDATLDVKVFDDYGPKDGLTGWLGERVRRLMKHDAQRFVDIPSSGMSP